jgi:hypothetical protein
VSSHYSDSKLDITCLKSSHTPSSRDHPDYDKNLTAAAKFIHNTNHQWGRGVHLEIKGSDHLRLSLFWISFDPPRTSIHPNIGHPISLHQDNKTFGDAYVALFNHMQNVSQNFQRKYPFYENEDYPRSLV